MPTLMGVVARGEDCTNVHLARFIAGVQKAGLDIHDISRAKGSADVLGYEVSPANAHCSGTSKRISRIRSVSWTVSSRCRISGRLMELVVVHESFLPLPSLMPASSLRERPTWFQESHGQLCVWKSYFFSAVIGVA